MTEHADFLESALLRGAGFRHAFFTRKGGVSQGAYSSLSFSVAAGDSEANVKENLERAAIELGVPSSRIYFRTCSSPRSRPCTAWKIPLRSRHGSRA